MSYEDEEIEESGGGEGWLVTWADMMSVLLTFFIVLQAYSTISNKKFFEAMASIQTALNVPLPMRAPGTDRHQGKTMAEEYEALIAEEKIDGATVQDFGDKIVLTLDSGVLFPVGKADLTPNGRQVIDKLWAVLGETKGGVQIQGHTCDLPVRAGMEYQDNWWLSSARALRVLEKVTAMGFPPERISATGMGEFSPVAPNDGEANRTRNRRVEFVIEKTPPPAD